MNHCTDDVRGIIIGGDAIRYEFWTKEAEPRFIAREYFRTDAEAITWWVRSEYAALYPNGAEMRVFDGPKGWR